MDFVAPHNDSIRTLSRNQEHIVLYSHFTFGHVSTSRWPCIQTNVTIHVQVSIGPWVSMCKWTRVHTHVAIYPRAGGHVSTWRWPCIYMQVAMYLHAGGHVSTCRWPCIHLPVYMCPHAGIHVSKITPPGLSILMK